MERRIANRAKVASLRPSSKRFVGADSVEMSDTSLELFDRARTKSCKNERAGSFKCQPRKWESVKGSQLPRGEQKMFWM